MQVIPIRTADPDTSDSAIYAAVASDLEALARMAHDLTQRIDLKIATLRSLSREGRRPFEDVEPTSEMIGRVL